MATALRSLSPDRTLSEHHVAAGGGGGHSPKSATGGAGGAGTTKDGSSAAMSIIINLEKEKLRLSAAITRDKRTVDDLEKHVTLLQSHVLAHRSKLGSYNALFMRMPDADSKAPRQRLGAREAVLGTKRIIRRELERLESEVVVAEMKLNRSRERNNVIREKINQLRREHVTYRHLFEKMEAELEELKSSIAVVDRAVDSEYSQRDRAYEEMRELAKQFEVDKVERLQLFRQVTEELESLPATTVAPPTAGGAGGRSPKSSNTGAAGGAGGEGGNSGEDALRKRVAKAQAKLAKDRFAIEQAHRKLAVFSNALRRIKASTGYSKTAEVATVFNRYEEEKFAKAQLAQRLMDEIESLETAVASMHEEVTSREAENARLKAARAAQIDSLQRSVSERQGELDETSKAVQRAVTDVKGLFRVIEFAFYALGIRSAMDEANGGKPFVAPTSPGAGGEGGESGGSPPSPVGGGARGSGGGFGPGGMLSPLGIPGSPVFGASGRGMPSPGGRQRSLSMYAGDARTRHAVRSGVSSSSLGAFMGTIESKSAEVIQQYAAVMSRVATGELQAAAMRAGFAAADGAAARRSAGGGGGDGEDGEDDEERGDDDISAAAAAVQARRAVQAFAAGSGDAARRLLANPAALGPSNPPGRVREAITASALMASLAVDSARMAGEMDAATAAAAAAATAVPGSGASAGALSPRATATAGDLAGLAATATGGAEDDSRLLSVAELKAQAQRRLNTDRNIQALKSAAAAAATVLVSAHGGGGGSGGGAPAGGLGTSSTRQRGISFSGR